MNDRVVILEESRDAILVLDLSSVASNIKRRIVISVNGLENTDEEPECSSKTLNRFCGPKN